MNKKVTITGWVDIPTYAKAEQVSKEENISISELVRRALDEYLKNFKTKEPIL